MPSGELQLPAAHILPHPKTIMTALNGNVSASIISTKKNLLESLNLNAKLTTHGKDLSNIPE